MTGAIPKYGADFRRESVKPDFERDLAQTRYVFKGNADWWIRSNLNSEHWWIFFMDHGLARTFGTFTEAMAAFLLAMRELGEDRR